MFKLPQEKFQLKLEHAQQNPWFNLELELMVTADLLKAGINSFAKHKHVAFQGSWLVSSDPRGSRDMFVFWTSHIINSRIIVTSL
jgi:hypothetical protein